MKNTQWYIVKLRGEKNRLSFTSEEACKIAKKIGIDFTKEKEIETRVLGHQREDGYDLVVFGKTANKDNGLIYKIVFIF